MQMRGIRGLIRLVVVCALAGAMGFGCAGKDEEDDNNFNNQNNTNGNTTPIVCGNGVMEVGEVCDGTDLDGRDCLDQGFDGGELVCGGDCTFDSSACTTCGNGVCEEGEVTACLRDCVINASVAAGSAHTCGLAADSTVWCWGDNGDGQLGDGTYEVRLVPTQVSGLAEGVDVAAGQYHSCALAADGAVWCWGYNGDGRLGDGTFIDSNTPVQVADLNDAVDVEVDHNHSCAIRTDSTVWCWGYGGDGQLGNDDWEDSNVPVQVVGLIGAVSITVGDYHTCAALADGTAWCWGYNGYLGLGTGEDYATLSAVATPVQVLGLTDAVQVTGGNFQSCARLASGQVWCWGVNVTGTLGDGSYTSNAAPVRVLAVSDAVDVTAGGYHACVARVSGEVWCWGNNEDGELGNGGWAPSPVVVRSTGVVGAAQVAGGSEHTCAALQDGTVSCWGKNWHGQLGLGSSVESFSATPVQVEAPGGLAAVEVSVGLDHACFIQTDQTLWCWGRGWQWDDDGLGWHGGHLGTGIIGSRPTPTQVAGLGNVTSVAPFRDHTCAVANGEVWCWGSNNHGQLGTTTLTESHTPVQVTLGASALQVVSGDAFSCAGLVDNTTWCWGSGEDGQLGNGGWTDSATPMEVPWMGANEMAAGVGHVCMLNDTDLFCWGSNWAGQLGDGTYDDSADPVQAAQSTYTFAVGSHHTCYQSSGSAYCMGWNYYGQVGQDPAQEFWPTAAVVPDLQDVKRLAAGHSHTCVITDPGEGPINTYCWGSGGSGQLGNGQTNDSFVPVNVQGLGTPHRLVLGRGYSCAVLWDDTVWCWGDASFGRLGTLDYWHHPVPTPVTGF